MTSHSWPSVASRRDGYPVKSGADGRAPSAGNTRIQTSILRPANAYTAWVQRIDLPSHPASPRHARLFVREVLTAWGVPDELLENAELLITELVTNAVIHASSDVSVEIRQDGDVVRFGVLDHGPGQIRMRVPAPGDVTGRGLYFLDQLAPDWTVSTERSGDKTVQFSLTGLRSDPGMTA